jgi:TonB-dependent starch-binding outer membrane protein SusC
MMKRLLGITAVALALAGATAAQAQETGSIRGRVVAGPERPVEGAQVVVVGTGRGVLTNSTGDFLLPGVSRGTHAIRVQHLGYGTSERVVAVVPGEVARLEFVLVERAIALDEIVVTGQPGATRRRALGASLASVEMGQLPASAPVANLQQVLQGRMAGVTSFGASGSAGAAGTLVLRGLGSMTQSSSPVVYVDGVRVDNRERALIAVGGQATSRLHDLAPSDIERIEVTRGAAAGSLYGTEASNGVIQIFTKRGRAGENAMEAGVRYGASRVPSVFPLMHPDPKFPSANDLIETGAFREVTASVHGASERSHHYVSGNYTEDQGSFGQNSFERAGGRLNLGLRPNERWQADFTSALGWSRAVLPSNDNNAFGMLANVILGNPAVRGTATDPYGGPWLTPAYAGNIRNQEETFRFTGGIVLQHRPSLALQQKFVVGVESVQGEAITTWPYGPNPFRPQGSREIGERSHVRANFDYAGSWLAALGARALSTFSAGGQLFTARDRLVYARGSRFPAPGLELIGATTTSIEIDERLLEYTTAGLFVQEQIGLNDRLFLTAGVRVDGSSAFGDDFGLQAYPKASVSYVLSEEAWFAAPLVSTLRLRAAFGRAGTQPGAFDSERTYGAFTANGGRPAIRTANPGNPDLAPEVSEEVEGGFDLNLLGDRVSLAVTAYRQVTRDALLSRLPAPSTGFTLPQLVNLGEVRNRGLEVGGSALLFAQGSVSWSATASYAYNQNVVSDMAGVARIEVDRFGTFVREGFPLAGKWGFVTVGTNAAGYPVRSDTLHFIGTSMPPHTGSLGSDLAMGPVRLFGHAQFAAGHVVNNHNRVAMIRSRTGKEYFDLVIANNDNPANPQTEAVKQFLHGPLNSHFGDYIEKADWLKVREIGASWTLPARLAGRMGADHAELTLAGRNLLTFTGYSGTDPEISSTFENGSLSVGADYFTVPQSRQVVFGVNVRF